MSSTSQAIKGHDAAVKVGGKRVATKPRPSKRANEDEEDPRTASSGAIEVQSHVSDVAQAAEDQLKTQRRQAVVEQRQHRDNIPSTHMQTGAQRADNRPVRVDQPARETRSSAKRAN